MKDATNQGGPQWSTSPTSKARNAVQRSVTALLDELAPERVLTRAEQLKGAIEQHRTPTGCVLQAADSAVSVSWFSEAAKDAPMGQLQVLVWRGKVTRRGTPPSRKGATIVANLMLVPVEPPEGDRLWQMADGTRYDTPALASKIVELLEAQIQAPD